MLYYILLLAGLPVGITENFADLEEKFEDGEIDGVKSVSSFQAAIDALAPYATKVAAPVNDEPADAIVLEEIDDEPVAPAPTPMSSLDMLKALIKEYGPIINTVLPKVTSHRLFPQIKVAFVETFGTTYKPFVTKLAAELKKAS